MYCHVAGHDCATCQVNIGCFQFSPLFTILIQFSPPIFQNDSILSSLIWYQISNEA